MKSLTTTAATQCASRYNEPVLLFEVDWSDTETGRYADRTVSVEGVAYTGVVLRVGPIACSFGEPASEFRPVTVTLLFDDALRSRIAETVPEGKSARIKLFFVGGTAADAIELFTGHVEKLTAAGPDAVELTLAGFFKRYDRMLPGDIVSLSEFPKAQADDVGRPMPVVFGDVPELPALKVKTGRSTRLRGSILSSDTTIEADETAGFPASGTLLIEEEQVTYSGVSENVFTGCTRGANDTEAVDHLNRREVIEYMTEHIYLVAGHACKAADDVRVAGVPVEQGACAINRNNTALVPGKSLTTITFVNRPKVRSYSRGSRFLEVQFDETAAGNEAINPDYCYDASLEGFATLVSKISGASNNDTLRIKQTTDVSGYETKYGEILKAFLMVEHFESTTFTDDYLSVQIAGQSCNLAKPSEEDTAGGEGEVDIDHGHTHSITGEHSHTMTVKKEAVFTNNIVQTGGSTGGWAELNDIAGTNLNRSGFTTSADTDKSLQCFVAATTSKGSVQKIQFCCRRGETNMAGSFYLRFYRNGSLEKTYYVSGTSTPQTFKSGWETISGLTWEDLDNANTYVLITPASGNSQVIRLFGVWYELEYLEQPDTYEGSGVKDSADVNDHSGTNAHVINEEPISSTSVVEGIDITDLVAKDWIWFNNREVWVDYNIAGSDDGVTGYVLHVFFEVEYAPFEEIVSDEVTCRVEGIETSGNGDGDLIENPADVVRHTMVSLLGFDEDAHIDADSFAATRESLETTGARFAFALFDQEKASDLISTLSEQSRSRLSFDSGRFRLVYRPDSLGEPARVISPSSLLAGSPRVQHMGLESVFNEVIGYHSRDYSKRGSIPDRYSDFSLAENAQSQAAYGMRESRLELFAISDAEYVQELLDFLAARYADPVRRYVWKSLLRDVDLERGDIAEICDLEMNLFKVKGEIVESTFLGGSGINREFDTIAFAAELEPYALYWSVPAGAFIRLIEDTFFFIVQRELVARLTSDGVFYIKGFVISDQAFPAATAHPLSYDSDRESIAFALSDNTRVMELDNDGNILLPLTQEGDQELTFSGSADEIDSDGSTLWFNVGSERAAEVTSAGLLMLPKYIVENCSWEGLYG